MHMHPPAARPTWFMGDLSLSTGGQPQQGRANAPGAPPLDGLRSKRLKPAASSRPLVKSRSTPQLQQRPTTMSETDAARNRSRLGYQRTTIACCKSQITSARSASCRPSIPRHPFETDTNTTLVHCRRRKIRCVVPENEPLQRCTNCIRLKRECQFHPVDQAGGPESMSNAPNGTSTVSSVVPPSPPHSSARTAIQLGQQQGGSQGPRLSMVGIPILPSTSLPEHGSYSAEIPQRPQFEAVQYPYPVQHPPPPTHGNQTWVPHELTNTSHQHTHMPTETAMSSRSAYPPQTGPALQPDTAPFPGSTDFHQMHSPYVDSGHFSHQPSPAQASQQWQQPAQPPFAPQYQQQDTYSATPWHEQQHHGNYPAVPDPRFGMAPGHIPHPAQYPHQPIQPMHSSPPQAGYYLPTQQTPTDWYPGQQPPPSSENRTRGYPSNDPNGHG